MAQMLRFIPEEDLMFLETFSELSQDIGWGLKLSNVEKAWEFTKGAGITIAVVDTGAPTHIDIIENLLSSYDVTGEGNADECGHGTSVSSIIAANHRDTGMVGIAPDAKIISVKCLDSSGHGNFDYVTKALKICLDLPIDIINMSLGIPNEPPDELHQVIKNLYAQGKILVAAAGNNGQAVNYPAAYDEVIAVAPIDKYSNLLSIASRGSKIQAAAPGLDIYCCHLNNTYTLMSGSSQAAPFVSGVLALILSHIKNNLTNDILLNSPHDILNLLEKMCEKHKTNTPDHYGIPVFELPMPWNKNV